MEWGTLIVGLIVLIVGTLVGLVGFTDGDLVGLETYWIDSWFETKGEEVELGLFGDGVGWEIIGEIEG